MIMLQCTKNEVEEKQTRVDASWTSASMTNIKSFLQKNNNNWASSNLIRFNLFLFHGKFWQERFPFPIPSTETGTSFMITYLEHQKMFQWISHLVILFKIFNKTLLKTQMAIFPFHFVYVILWTPNPFYSSLKKVSR